MKTNAKTQIRQLIKSLRKVRKGMTFAEDNSVFYSGYQLDFNDKAFRDKVKKNLEELKKQKEAIQNCSSSITGEIEHDIGILENILNSMPPR